ncbi:Holliday junction resolvase RuvX [candidate division WWE3 bacterium]|nr:Holliday junction resolvase RuvX [candidate division WWE3 bacterium]
MAVSSTSSAPGILGIDYGETNIGLAFGRGGMVTPLRVVSGKNDNTAVSAIGRVAKEYKVARFVVGLPLTVEGKETPQSLKVRKFVKVLKSQLKLPVDLVSEHSTSKGAVKVMLNAGVSQKRRRTKDHYSAAIILRRYFRNRT